MRRTVKKRMVSLDHLAGRKESPAGSFLARRQTDGAGHYLPSATVCFAVVHQPPVFVNDVPSTLMNTRQAYRRFGRMGPESQRR